jgi:hypothetical protein
MAEAAISNKESVNEPNIAVEPVASHAQNFAATMLAASNRVKLLERFTQYA